MPGRAERWCGEQEAAAAVLAAAIRPSSWRYQSSPRGDAELEEAEVVDREERVAAGGRGPWPSKPSTACSCRRPAPRSASRAIQSRRVPSLGVEVGARREQLAGVGIAGPLHHLGGEAGVEEGARHPARRRRRRRPSPAAAAWPGSTARQSSAEVVAEGRRGPPRPCTPWNAMCSRPRCLAMERASSSGGADQVRPGAVAVVVHGLLDAVAVGVETRHRRGRASPIGWSTAARGSRRRRPTRRRTSGRRSHASRSCGR